MERQENIIIHSKSSTSRILILLVLLLLTTSGVLFYLYTKEKETKTNDQIQQTSLESEKVMKDLSQILLMPEGEAPSIATIVDIEKLKKENAIFYADANNGDNLIIFTKRAIIYRANEKKIINIAPIVASDKTKDDKTITPIEKIKAETTDTTNIEVEE